MTCSILFQIPIQGGASSHLSDIESSHIAFINSSHDDKHLEHTLLVVNDTDIPPTAVLDSSVTPSEIGMSYDEVYTYHDSRNQPQKHSITFTLSDGAFIKNDLANDLICFEPFPY